MNILERLLQEYQELPEFSSLKLSSVNQRGGWNSTPLHIAIYRERPREVRILLEGGADPNAPGEYGERPIQVALGQDEEIIEMLLSAGAQCDLTDDKGKNAWDWAEGLGLKDKLIALVNSHGQRPR